VGSKPASPAAAAPRQLRPQGVLQQNLVRPAPDDVQRLVDKVIVHPGSRGPRAMYRKPAARVNATDKVRIRKENRPGLWFNRLPRRRPARVRFIEPHASDQDRCQITSSPTAAPACTSTPPLALSALVAASALAPSPHSPVGAPGRRRGRRPDRALARHRIALPMAEDTSGDATAVASTADAEPGPPPAAEAATRSAATDAEAPSVAVVPADSGRCRWTSGDRPPAAARRRHRRTRAGTRRPSRWRDHTVKKGETLAQVLKAFGWTRTTGPR